MRVQIDHRDVLRVQREQPAVIRLAQGKLDRFRGQRVGQRPDPEVTEEDAAVRVVALQGEGSLAQGTFGADRFRLQVIDRLEVVHMNGDPVCTDSDPEFEPGVVRRHGAVEVPHAVEAPRLLQFTIAALAVMAVVDLDFESLRGPVGFLVGRMEKDPEFAPGRVWTSASNSKFLNCAPWTGPT